MSTKAKQIRNKQKKIDNIIKDEAKLQSKDFKPDKDFLSKIERRPALEAELKDLQDQIELYIKSNPNYANKSDAPRISEQDVHNRVVAAFRLVGNMRTIHALLQADSSFVEISDSQRAALDGLANAFNTFVARSNSGVDSFQNQSHIGEFAEHFAALAAGAEGATNGVSFKDLRHFIEHSLSDAALLARTNQRIANKQLEKEAEVKAEPEATHAEPQSEQAN